MKTLKYFSRLFLSSIILLSSCRSEETIVIDPPTKNAIKANSRAANLMSRTALKDGSIDNIIDKANCLTVKLPVNITVNGEDLLINGESDYDKIEEIFDEFKTDTDSILIKYPIEVIFSDYTVKTVNSNAELIEFSKECKDENEEDDDIECIDFQFPIEISSFNTNSELVTIIKIENDNQLYDFINNIDNSSIVTINFPVKLIQGNGTFTEVENIDALEDTIEDAENSCDEDDDNDYNDDDCNECSIDKLKILFDSQNKFNVDDLERNGTNLDNQYTDYLFLFGVDGTITIYKSGTTLSGTWEASGSGNEISFTINIPDLTDFNDTWTLHETKTNSGKVNIEFTKGEDELEFTKTL